jgi:hypothetical protein
MIDAAERANKIKLLRTALTCEFVSTVEFIKLDGTVRTMNCTLNMSLIPEDAWPIGADTESLDTVLTVMRVFDTDIEEWRSFRIDNVSKVTCYFDTDE